jgi:hypothetical protein
MTWGQSQNAGTRVGSRKADFDPRAAGWTWHAARSIGGGRANETSEVPLDGELCGMGGWAPVGDPISHTFGMTCHTSFPPDPQRPLKAGSLRKGSKV